MTNFRIPLEVAERGTGGGGGDWTPEEGIWRGQIEATYINPVASTDDGGPKFVLQSKGAFVAQQAEVGSIQIGNLQPTEDGQSDPGNRKFFDELLIFSADGTEWTSEPTEGELWRLDQTRNRLTNLALALNDVETVEEDGVTFVTPSNEFADDLRNTLTGDDGRSNGLAGAEVMFEIVHENFKRRDGSDATRAKISKYITSV